MSDKEDLKEKYKKRIKAELEGRDEINLSSEYKTFKEERREQPSNFYEKLCKLSEKYVGVTPDANYSKKIEEATEFARISVTPKGVYSFAIVAPILLIFILGTPALLLGQSGFFLFFLFLLGGLLSIGPLTKVPLYIADDFRLKASNQMVLAVFYLVTYMRHTSNLERAIEFAGNYLSEPMSFEFKKILWDVETGKFDNINESIENFLSKWREHNSEFVDAVHLVEGSLLESSDSRRIEILDKALDVILDETYEKMLHFAHNLQSPITTLHMLGIILPILGLVILPLMVSFMEEIKWYHISVVYNFFLPIMVFMLGRNILAKRPSGYGETPINENNQEIKKAMNNKVRFFTLNTGIKPKPFMVSFVIIFLLLGISPLIMNFIGVQDFGWGMESQVTECGKRFCFLGYRDSEVTLTNPISHKIGPYGLGATIVSVILVLGLGLGIGLYYRTKSEKLMEIFERSHKLEKEFSSALFQLANKLGDNLPAETATIKVAESLPETNSGNFFKIVSINIQKLGMSVQDAIFNSRVGAIVLYPSELIESSMKVLVQSVKKGPLIASNALSNISRYVKEMHKVEERLKDLMAEVISSMKSQINFLTPVIAAVVVGISSMMATIIGFLSTSMGELGSTMPADSMGQMGMITEFFKNSLPTFYFQIIVGIYVLQITYILSILINSIEHGSDKVNKEYILGKSLIKTAVTYSTLTIILIVVFNFVASSIMPAGLG